MHHYRGWSSTKLHLALVAMGIVTIIYLAMGMPKELFGTFCLTIAGAAGVYSGTSVMQGRGAPPAGKAPVD